MQHDKLVDESEVQLQDAARNVALAKAIRKLGKQYREAIINVHIWTNLRYCEKSLENLHFMQFLRLAQSCGEREAKEFAKGPIPPHILNRISAEVPVIQGKPEDLKFDFFLVLLQTATIGWLFVM